MPHQNHAVHIAKPDDDLAGQIMDELRKTVKHLRKDAKKKKAQIEAFKKQLHSRNKVTTTLTPSEIKYIKQMYDGEPKGIKDISQLPLGWVALFIENREEEPKEVWPDDHSITEKYLAFHNLPADMTFAQWQKWVNRQPKHLR
jgi:hypothetical protein